MNSVCLVESFFKLKNGKKAILAADNTPIPDENKLKSEEIKVTSLPFNVTSLCHSMDQRVIETRKSTGINFCHHL
jgi:hypothetical protein